MPRGKKDKDLDGGPTETVNTGPSVMFVGQRPRLRPPWCARRVREGPGARRHTRGHSRTGRQVLDFTRGAPVVVDGVCVCVCVQACTSVCLVGLVGAWVPCPTTERRLHPGCCGRTESPGGARTAEPETAPVPVTPSRSGLESRRRGEGAREGPAELLGTQG